jgi:tetratricopeptide (TPR) repeat protein
MSRYCAFISYSHSDARFAAWLQRNLENFRIPPATRQKLNHGGNRLGPVFRDVADLGAATKLTAALSEALSRSKALIIICSPQSVASKWVALEIGEFRSLHGDDALILPIVSPTAGTAAAEDLFPETLGKSPPLAADARRSFDGRRVALLKLIAGLLGTGLDELIQRDARRRHARLVGGISVTTVLAVVMAVLAAFAISAREDAKRRLSQSEDLIGFMLGDLRKQLQPLGQIGVLESVGAKAQTYFESLDDQDLTQAALLRKSRALYQIGEVYFELGEFEAAHNSFGLSLEQARQLVSAQPDNIERLFEWSQAEFWAGYAAFWSGDLNKAQVHLETYRDLAWALLDREPDNPDWVMETFWASNNLGSLAYKHGRFADAIGHFSEAIARIDLLIEQQATAERAYEKTSTLSWLGSTYFHLGELTSAKKHFQRALEQPLDPENALHKVERSHVLRKLAEVEIYRGEMITARSHITSALDIATALSKSDPDSMELLYARTTHAWQLALINLFEGLPVDLDELIAATDLLLGAESPPPLWQALAMKVAEVGIRSGKPNALPWAKNVLNQINPEADGWGTIEQVHLSLIVSIAEIDPSYLPAVEKYLPAQQARYQSNQDFALILPLIRSYRLLGRQEQIIELEEVLEQAESRHPECSPCTAEPRLGFKSVGKDDATG